MAPYAYRTKVPEGQSRTDIERLLRKHDASGYIFGSTNGHAMVGFEMRGWRLRFMLPMPIRKRGDSDTKVAAETRRRWRALLLVLKAKLEAVESGIIEFEREFLAHIVTDGASTVGDQIIPNLAGIVTSGKMPPLLGPGGD